MSGRIVLSYTALASLLDGERRAGRTVALANGCFDVLHVGHVRLLEQARAEADILVVALNTDESVRANKGANRPKVPLAERAELVAALRAVDYVTSFAEATAAPMIGSLRPDVLVKGTDRTATSIPAEERAALDACGARVAICGDTKTHSSSALIDRDD